MSRLTRAHVADHADQHVIDRALFAASDMVVAVSSGSRSDVAAAFAAAHGLDLTALRTQLYSAAAPGCRPDMDNALAQVCDGLGRLVAAMVLMANAIPEDRPTSAFLQHPDVVDPDTEETTAARRRALLEAWEFDIDWVAA